jgi:hypothetical protein
MPCVKAASPHLLFSTTSSIYPSFSIATLPPHIPAFVVSSLSSLSSSIGIPVHCKLGVGKRPRAISSLSVSLTCQLHYFLCCVVLLLLFCQYPNPSAAADPVNHLRPRCDLCRGHPTYHALESCLPSFHLSYFYDLPGWLVTLIAILLDVFQRNFLACLRPTRTAVSPQYPFQVPRTFRSTK